MPGTNAVCQYRHTDLFAPPLCQVNSAILRMLRFALTTGALTPWSVTSVTRVGTTATATVASTASLVNGLSVTISGASDPLYNGTFAITVASATTFTYTMGGTPAASPAVGTMVMTPVAQTVSSITRSGSTATATFAIGDPSMMTGDWHTFAGATQPEYNGTFQITVLSSTQVTFTVSGTPASPATGSPTHYKSGAGWTEPFTGTDKAVFRGGSTNNSAQFYLRVLNDASLTGGAINCGSRGFETMSDVDTGTGPFPTVAQMANGVFWRSSASGTGGQPYFIVADDRYFQYWSDTQGGNTTGNNGFFGWFASNKSGDAYNCCIGGDITVNSNSSQGCWVVNGIGGTTTSTYIARGVSQTGGAVLGAASCLVNGSTVIGAVAGITSVTYPSPSHNGLIVQPIFMSESGCDRGRLPCYSHAHAAFTAPTLGDPFTGVQGLSGVTLRSMTCKSTSTAGFILVDVTGPWA